MFVLYVRILASFLLSSFGQNWILVCIHEILMTVWTGFLSSVVETMSHNIVLCPSVCALA